jgi:hypothetical protein
MYAGTRNIFHDAEPPGCHKHVQATPTINTHSVYMYIYVEKEEDFFH